MTPCLCRNERRALDQLFDWVLEAVCSFVNCLWKGNQQHRVPECMWSKKWLDSFGLDQECLGGDKKIATKYACLFF